MKGNILTFKLCRGQRAVHHGILRFSSSGLEVTPPPTGMRFIVTAVDLFVCLFCAVPQYDSTTAVPRHVTAETSCGAHQ